MTSSSHQSSSSEGIERADLSVAPWRALLPWLNGYRSGPAISVDLVAADGDVSGNSWIESSPARTIDPAGLDRFCERVADRYLRDRSDRRLSLDFPVVSPDLRIDDLPAGSDTRKALTRTIGDMESLLTHSPIGVMAEGVGASAIHETIEAFVRLSALTDRPGVDAQATAAVSDFVESLNGRERLVLGDRVLAARPSTQSELADIIGTSRERVTQIDRAMRARIRHLVEASPGLADLARAITDRATPVTDAEGICHAVPLASTPVGDTGAEFWRLAAVAAGLRATDEWIIRGSLRSVAETTRSVVGDAASPEGAAPVHRVAAQLGLTRDATRHWLKRTGFALLDDHAIAATASTGDLVAAVLAIADEPQDFDQISAALTAFPRADASIRNALVADPRIIKTDRTHYGLVRWGGTRYEPVHVQIGKIVDARGGRVPLDDIVAVIRNRYDVSAASIRAYAGAGEFMTSNGVVSRRERPFRPRKTPARTRGLFRDGETTHWATTITGAQVRGSNFNIPSALAGLIGVRPGTPVTLDSRLGPQSFVWASVQARSGSINRFVADMGLADGDPVFLDFAPNRFDVRRAGTRSRSIAAAILDQLGRRPQRVTRSEIADVLIESLWLPDGSGIEAVIEQLRLRKDTTLLELVEKWQSSSRRGG
ncbi:sigma factor-like helix-turn-helix DNA-binding protein [Gordonia terrae]|uniref:sigma factor-like helix-turn-helix DNA-binding protein n=1 Tax=Gordonia terrae TaxID=2055 RepID=UPI003F6C7FC6